MAITSMMMSLAALGKGDIQSAEALEQKAVKYLSEEERTRNPGDLFSFEFDNAIGWASPRQGII